MEEKRNKEHVPSTLKQEYSFISSLVAGGMAGMAVDISLYPLDTIKTRLQSSQGFIKAGGFRGVYAGLGIAALGSAPGAALFFSSYETCKKFIPEIAGPRKLADPTVHMLSASCAEIVACLVRVPTEVMKQRYQANIVQSKSSLWSNIREIYLKDGLAGFYRGYGSTILREIPFSLVQFPLYEWMKKKLATSIFPDREIKSYEAAMCGSISGGFAAAVTTPLDVIKTRLMLGKDAQGIEYRGLSDTIRRLSIEAREKFQQELTLQQATKSSSTNSTAPSVGRSYFRVFFAGVQPRVMWISIGGFVFFGAYEQALKMVFPLLSSAR